MFIISPDLFTPPRVVARLRTVVVDLLFLYIVSTIFYSFHCTAQAGSIPRVSFLIHIDFTKQKCTFEHAQNAQIQIILRMRKVSSGPLLSIHTLGSIQ